LPRGYEARSVTTDNGRVMVGALSPGQRFVWIDADPEFPARTLSTRMPAACGPSRASPSTLYKR